MARNSGTAVAPRRDQQGPPAQQQNSPTRDLRKVLESGIDRIEQALPKHLTAERVLQVVTTMAYNTPKLAQCDPHSILACVVQASSLGLDLSPGMMEGFLIPRWNSKAGCNVCTFMPGYRGIVKLAMQSGEIAQIRSAVVHEQDEFTYLFDPDLVFRHKPALFNKGQILGVYAIASFKDPGTPPQPEFMSHEEIELVRGRSQSPNDGPWVTDWAEMARKTVLKRLCKSLPRSLERLNRVIEIDNAEYQILQPQAGGQGRPTRAQMIAASLGASGALPAPDQPEAVFSVEEPVQRPLATEEPPPDQEVDYESGDGPLFDQAAADEALMASEGGRHG